MSGFSVRSFTVLCVISSLAIISLRKWGTSCFTFVVFRMPCHCYLSLTLPRDAIWMHVVCDCGISWFSRHESFYL